MESKPVNVHEAKTHFSKLIARVMAGEEIVIAKAGKPVARLVPCVPPPKPRVPGTGKGLVWESADCWDPMTDEEVAEWEKDDLP